MTEQEIIQYQDDKGRQHISTIVHWENPEGSAHCLMQAILLPNNNLKVFLAELKTCPRWQGIFYYQAGAVNAVWKFLEKYLNNLKEIKVEWFFRSGKFSSYDLGQYETTTHYIFKQDNNGKWLYKEYNNFALKPEEEQQLIQLTNVADVEDDLAKFSPLPPLNP